MDHLIEDVTLYRTSVGFLCFAHHYPVYAVGTTLQACVEGLYGHLKALLTSGRRTVNQAVSGTADAQVHITQASRTPQFQIHIFDAGWERSACKIGMQRHGS